jgi:hypothetical protein
MRIERRIGPVPPTPSQHREQQGGRRKIAKRPWRGATGDLRRALTARVCHDATDPALRTRPGIRHIQAQQNSLEIAS